VLASAFGSTRRRPAIRNLPTATLNALRGEVA
jgi:hypothetical protein